MRHRAARPLVGIVKTILPLQSLLARSWNLPEPEIEQGTIYLIDLSEAALESAELRGIARQAARPDGPATSLKARSWSAAAGIGDVGAALLHRRRRKPILRLRVSARHGAKGRLLFLQSIEK